MTPLTLTQRFNRIPPWACRVLARKHRRPMTNCEIAQFAGLSVRNVIRIAKLKKWDGVSLVTLEKFTTACGIDLIHPRRHFDYLKRYKLAFITRGNPATRRALMKLIESA